MASLSGIRSGLKTRLATISGLRVVEYFPDVVRPPTAVIGGDGTVAEYKQTMGNSVVANWTVPILVLVQRVSGRGGQADLDLYVDSSGSKSISVAIAADPTLGGLGIVKKFTLERYGPFTVGTPAQNFLGALFLAEFTSHA